MATTQRKKTPQKRASPKSPANKPDKKKFIVLVGIPVIDGRPTTETMNSWTNLLARGSEEFESTDYDVNFVLRFLDGESLITRGRNQIVRDFMERYEEDGTTPVFTHLLFIDSDIGFTINNVRRLLDADYEVSGGIYPIKMFNWKAIEAGIPPQVPYVEILRALTVPVVNGIDPSTVGENGFAECMELGTGFLLIKREAILKLREAFPENLPSGGETLGSSVGASWYITDYRQGENVRVDNFFDDFVVDWPTFNEKGEQVGTHRRLLSEDYAFCWLWRQIGGKVMVDTAGEILAHRGMFTWGRG